MSKAFTALAILKLRDEGRLSLDALAETYVPELRGWRYPTGDSPRIRVRDLLSHVGGFVTDDPWGDRQTPLPEAEFTAMLAAGVPFTRAPQPRSNIPISAIALLGRIVTNVSGRPFKDYIEQEIMRPLGMASTGYDISASPQRAPRARLSLGERALVRASRTWRTARSARWAASRPAPTIMRAGSPSCSRPGRRATGPKQGPVRRSSVRELAQGLNFSRTQPRGARQRRRAVPRRPSPTAMGFACRAGLRPRPHPGAWRRLSRLRLLPAAPARPAASAIFAFANRTYAGPSPPVWDAALELHRRRPAARRGPAGERGAGGEPIAPPAPCTQAGSLAPGRGRLAMNFLMDRSAETGPREFAAPEGA